MSSFQKRDTKLESRYFSRVFLLHHYGLSTITSKVNQIISVIKTKRSVFPEKWYYKNSSFWHFNSSFVLNTTKTQVLVLITEIIWRTFWNDNWQSIIDIKVPKLNSRLVYCPQHYGIHFLKWSPFFDRLVLSANSNLEIRIKDFVLDDNLWPKICSIL